MHAGVGRNTGNRVLAKGGTTWCISLVVKIMFNIGFPWNNYLVKAQNQPKPGLRGFIFLFITTFAKAAVTKDHRLGSLKKGNLFSCSCGG